MPPLPADSSDDSPSSRHRTASIESLLSATSFTFSDTSTSPSSCDTESTSDTIVSDHAFPLSKLARQIEIELGLEIDYPDNLAPTPVPAHNLQPLPMNARPLGPSDEYRFDFEQPVAPMMEAETRTRENSLPSTFLASSPFPSPPRTRAASEAQASSFLPPLPLPAPQDGHTVHQESRHRAHASLPPLLPGAAPFVSKRPTTHERALSVPAYSSFGPELSFERPPTHASELSSGMPAYNRTLRALPDYESPCPPHTHHFNYAPVPLRNRHQSTPAFLPPFYMLPGPSPNNKKGELYKTEMCRSWLEIGACRYGDRCQFAHGPQELQSLPRRFGGRTGPFLVQVRRDLVLRG